MSLLPGHVLCAFSHGLGNLCKTLLEEKGLSSLFPPQEAEGLGLEASYNSRN